MLTLLFSWKRTAWLGNPRKSGGRRSSSRRTSGSSRRVMTRRSSRWTWSSSSCPRRSMGRSSSRTGRSSSSTSWTPSMLSWSPGLLCQRRPCAARAAEGAAQILSCPPVPLAASVVLGTSRWHRFHTPAVPSRLVLKLEIISDGPLGKSRHQGNLDLGRNDMHLSTRIPKIPRI